jgi:hypothetical protein
VLIECKEDPFDRWKGEIESQIFQYVRNFKPKLLIVASLKTVPESIKSYLQSQGIKIVDDLRPNSKSISVICDLIRGELGK